MPTGLATTSDTAGSVGLSWTASTGGATGYTIYRNGTALLSAPVTERVQTQNGYHLESWWSNGMVFWAVSDLNETELQQFVLKLRQSGN